MDLPPGTLSVRRFRVAGYAVDVLFGGGGLEEQYSARLGLPPGAGEEGPADFRLFVLTGGDIGMESLPRWADPGLRGHRFEMTMDAASLSMEYPAFPGVFRVFDRVRRVGVLLIGSVTDLPVWHGGAPLVDLVRFALAAHDLRIVHGATLGRNGNGILLVGDGGAGKSGTTLAGLRAGLQSVGDDYVAVGFEGDRPVARLLYRFMKQDRAGLGRHAGHAVAGVPGEPNWHGKVEFDPRPYFPDCVTERLELKAVVIPQISAGRAEPEIAPVPAADALRVALRTNIIYSSTQTSLRFFARLFRLPRYRMALTSDPVANGAALARLAESL